MRNTNTPWNKEDEEELDRIGLVALSVAINDGSSANPAEITGRTTAAQLREMDGTTTAKPYRFPVNPSMHSVDIATDDELTLELDRLCQSRAGLANTLVSYELIRDRVCSINLTMNKRGIRPPSFRASRKSSPGEPKSPLLNVLSRDRMVIDLHWLHSNGYRRTLHDQAFHDFLVHDEFNFAMAEQFVTMNWKTEARVTQILLLSDVEQWQMGVLLEQEVRDEVKRLKKESKIVNCKLRSVVQRTGRLLPEHVEDFTQLWLADQMCGGGPQDLIGRIHGWQRGHIPLTKATMSAKLKRMRRWTAKTYAGAGGATARGHAGTYKDSVSCGAA